MPSGLSMSGEKCLVIRGVVVRFNPADDPYGGLADVSDDDRARGVIQAIGFRAEDCTVIGCRFMPDPSVPEGSIVLVPVSPTHPEEQR